MASASEKSRQAVLAQPPDKHELAVRRGSIERRAAAVDEDAPDLLSAGDVGGTAERLVQVDLALARLHVR